MNDIDPADMNVRESVLLTIDSLAIDRQKYAGLIAQALKVADALDNPSTTPHAVAMLAPGLLNSLTALQATPAARADNTKTSAPESPAALKLAQLRAAN